MATPVAIMPDREYHSKEIPMEFFTMALIIFGAYAIGFILGRKTK